MQQKLCKYSIKLYSFSQRSENVLEHWKWMRHCDGVNGSILRCENHRENKKWTSLATLPSTNTKIRLVVSFHVCGWLNSTLAKDKFFRQNYCDFRWAISFIIHSGHNNASLFHNISSIILVSKRKDCITILMCFESLLNQWRLASKDTRTDITANTRIRDTMESSAKMEFCPPNVTLSQIWLNHGISHCFMDTVSTSIIAGFILICGTLQLLMYRRYSMPIEDVQNIRRSCLYNFQIFLIAFVPMLALVRFVLQAVVYNDDGAVVYGYMVCVLQYNVNALRTAHQFNLFLFISVHTDSCRWIDRICFSVFDMFNCERTLLFVANGAVPWPRCCFVTVLDANLYQWEFGVCQYATRRLVVSFDQPERQNWDVTVCAAICCVFVNICDWIEGARHCHVRTELSGFIKWWGEYMCLWKKGRSGGLNTLLYSDKHINISQESAYL